TGNITDNSTRNTAWRYAMVFIEFTVFSCNERFDQGFRNFIQLDQYPVFVMLWINSTNQSGFQSGNTARRWLGGANLSHLISTKTHFQNLFRFNPITKIKATGMYI